MLTNFITDCSWRSRRPKKLKLSILRKQWSSRSFLSSSCSFKFQIEKVENRRRKERESSSPQALLPLGINRNWILINSHSLMILFFDKQKIPSESGRWGIFSSHSATSSRILTQILCICDLSQATRKADSDWLLTQSTWGLWLKFNCTECWLSKAPSLTSSSDWIESWERFE